MQHSKALYYLALYEKNFVLVWDDISTNIFLTNDQLFSLFKSGCNRKTSIIKIAGKDGTNLDFDTFSPKFVSTVSPFWTHPQLGEFKRRLLLFYFKPIDTAIGFNTLSVDEINFNGFSNQLVSYWNNVENRVAFKAARRTIGKLKSDIIPIETLRLYQDAIATNCALGMGSPKEILSIWELHYQYVTENILDASLGIKKILKEWIDIKILEYESMLISRNLPMIDLTIKPSLALNFLEDCYKEGELTEKIDRNYVDICFVGLGFKKQKYQGSYQWVKVINNPSF